MTEPSLGVPAAIAAPPRVFISYAHDSDAHRELVRDLWVFLCANGVDARIDLVAAEQRQDWTLWTEQEVAQADRILIVASPAYRQRAGYETDPAVGRGVQWEARLIRDLFYRNQSDLGRFLPVVLPGGNSDDLPAFMASASSTSYRVSEFTLASAEALLRVIHRRPGEVQPEIGPAPELPTCDHTPTPSRAAKGGAASASISATALATAQNNARQIFFAQLRSLHRAAGEPKLGSLSPQVSPQRISAWMSENIPRSFREFQPVLESLILRSRRRGAAEPEPGVYSLEQWQILWQACLADRSRAKDRMESAPGPLASNVRNAAQPPPGLRVCDFSAELLGVHKAISSSDGTNSTPTYIDRDIDNVPGFRSLLEDALTRNCFILLVGPSSVGKTRSLYEGITAVLPDWKIVNPEPGSDSIKALVQESAHDPVVVWLDEIQKYLQKNGLSLALVRELLASKRPIVLAGTIWTSLFDGYTKNLQNHGALDLEIRGVLELSAVFRVRQQWTKDELARADAAARCDKRLQRAIELSSNSDERFSIPQILAAAPQIKASWLDADGYLSAVLHAAIDAVRIGVYSPLTETFLRFAAVGYCDNALQSRAPYNWFEGALSEARRPLHGATSLLEPIAQDGMGNVCGYRVADYLLDYVGPRRLGRLIPHSLWTSVIANTSDSSDAGRVATSAAMRGYFPIAIELFERARNGEDSPGYNRYTVGAIQAFQAGSTSFYSYPIDPYLEGRQRRTLVNLMGSDSDPYSFSWAIEKLQLGDKDGEQCLLTMADIGHVLAQEHLISHFAGPQHAHAVAEMYDQPLEMASRLPLIISSRLWKMVIDLFEIEYERTRSQFEQWASDGCVWAANTLGGSYSAGCGCGW